VLLVPGNGSTSSRVSSHASASRAGVQPFAAALADAISEGHVPLERPALKSNSDSNG
jgi:hypothetical protein